MAGLTGWFCLAGIKAAIPSQESFAVRRFEGFPGKPSKPEIRSVGLATDAAERTGRAYQKDLWLK